MSEYVLRTRGISKKYGSSYALQNVSIEVKRGQIYGLIGLNGTGKDCGIVRYRRKESERFLSRHEAAFGVGNSAHYKS